MLTITDGTQSITLWHYQDDTTTEISTALIRRFRHRRYSQVVDTAVPANYAHWYFSTSTKTAHPLPGDEIHESDGTLWTILEVNLSSLTGIWQAVCETFAFAEPTEHVDHLRAGMTIAELIPVRVGAMTETMESDIFKRLTFYVRDTVVVEPEDVFQRTDGSLWKIVRIERPKYRARWTAVSAVEIGTV
jgi:hypothetical protein